MAENDAEYARRVNARQEQQQEKMRNCAQTNWKKLKGVQCTAQVQDRTHRDRYRRCRLTSRRHTPYCWQHLRKYEQLRVKESTIAGIGVGLFTETTRQEGDMLIEYTGHLYRTKAKCSEIGNDHSEYVTSSGQNPYVVPTAEDPNQQHDLFWCIDACTSVASSAARYINDCYNPGTGLCHVGTSYNCIFVFRSDPQSQEDDANDLKHRIFVVATRDIEAGEELFVEYGPAYWENYDERRAVTPASGWNPYEDQLRQLRAARANIVSLRPGELPPPPSEQKGDEEQRQLIEEKLCDYAVETELLRTQIVSKLSAIVPWAVKVQRHSAYLAANAGRSVTSKKQSDANEYNARAVNIVDDDYEKLQEVDAAAEELNKKWDLDKDADAYIAVVENFNEADDLIKQNPELLRKETLQQGERKAHAVIPPMKFSETRINGDLLLDNRSLTNLHRQALRERQSDAHESVRRDDRREALRSLCTLVRQAARLEKSVFDAVQHWVLFAQKAQERCLDGSLPQNYAQERQHLLQILEDRQTEFTRLFVVAREQEEQQERLFVLLFPFPLDRQRPQQHRRTKRAYYASARSHLYDVFLQIRRRVQAFLDRNQHTWLPRSDNNCGGRPSLIETISEPNRGSARDSGILEPVSEASLSVRRGISEIVLICADRYNAPNYDRKPGLPVPPPGILKFVHQHEPSRYFFVKAVFFPMTLYAYLNQGYRFVRGHPRTEHKATELYAQGENETTTLLDDFVGALREAKVRIPNTLPRHANRAEHQRVRRWVLASLITQWWPGMPGIKHKLPNGRIQYYDWDGYFRDNRVKNLLLRYKLVAFLERAGRYFGSRSGKSAYTRLVRGIRYGNILRMLREDRSSTTPYRPQADAYDIYQLQNNPQFIANAANVDALPLPDKKNAAMICLAALFLIQPRTWKQANRLYRMRVPHGTPERGWGCAETLSEGDREPEVLDDACQLAFAIVRTYPRSPSSVDVVEPVGRRRPVHDIPFVRRTSSFWMAAFVAMNNDERVSAWNVDVWEKDYYGNARFSFRHTMRQVRRLVNQRSTPAQRRKLSELIHRASQGEYLNADLQEWFQDLWQAKVTEGPWTTNQVLRAENTRDWKDFFAFVEQSASSSSGGA